jgi:hypothetical protein
MLVDHKVMVKKKTTGGNRYLYHYLTASLLGGSIHFVITKIDMIRSCCVRRKLLCAL